MSFLESLVTKGIISRDQIDEVIAKAEETKGDMDDALVAMGVSEEAILEAKQEHFGIAARRVTQVIPFDVLKYIPADSARHYRLVPLAVKDGMVEVGMVNPDDAEARNALQFIFSKTSTPFQVFLISPGDFKKAIENYKGLTGEVDRAVTDIQSEVEQSNEALMDIEKEAGKKEEGEEEKIVEDAPVTKMVAVILRHAIEGRASDVHIESTGEKVKVRFRVDGVLYTSLMLPLSVHNPVVARIKILATLKLDEKRKPQDGRFFAKIEGRQIDFRVSTLPTHYGEKVVVRVLDPGRGVKTFDELGMREEHQVMLREALKKPYGIILITGPTGSGKSTTLYSMLNELDREKNNVVSLEDPIEYDVASVNQSQVRPEIGYTFANGLRSILRQDPDIIMVGEIRDKETAALAIQAALTGHLVFSTLHTNNATGVIPRLVDMGVDPYLIAPTLVLAIAQRLVKKVCDGGAKAVAVDGSMKKMIESEIADLPAEKKKMFNLSGEVFEAEPTPECPDGTRGRLAVFEMFQMDKDVEQIILNDPNEMKLEKLLRTEKGMTTMKEDAILKTQQGLISFHEIANL